MSKKHLGQNFLYDPAILNEIIRAADLTEEDTVVEIGPGPGKLTRLLAKKARKIIAIELDLTLVNKLRDKFSFPSSARSDAVAFDNVEIVHGDALKFPYDTIGDFKVVANIPYYITTPIIFKLLESRKSIISMTLTIQKEVAERIVAIPGGKKYGVLSIMIQYYARPELKFIIPKEAFSPIPKVDSAVIHMTTLKEPPVIVQDETFFFSIVKKAFSQRRKTLSNSLKGVRKDIKDCLLDAGIDPQRRPETLGLADFARLSSSLGKK